MKNRLLKTIMIISTLVVSIMIVMPNEVSAASVKVSATRDDIYNQLLYAAKVNVIGNTMKKCVSMIYSEDYSSTWGGALSASDVQKGNIFQKAWKITGEQGTRSTALWVEELVQSDPEMDGGIYCYQDDGRNIFVRFSELTEIPINDMLCDGGSHRLVQRTKQGGTSSWEAKKLDPTDSNCSSFNDSKASYLKASDASDQFKSLYNSWRNSKLSSNPYIPDYDSLGSFNNVDGYFSYLEDFNTMCSVDSPVTVNNKLSNTTYYGITKFTRDGNKLVAQKLYYHINDNKTWDYALSEDHQVTSCNGLLERVAALESQNNEVTTSKDKSEGYGGIMVADLYDACKGVKTVDGSNGWSELKKKLQDIVDGVGLDDLPAEEKTQLQTDAQSNLDELNDIINNNRYVEYSGSRDSEEGQIYQCANIDGLDISIDEYILPTLDPDGNNNATTEINCMSSGAAQTLGWIVCPVLDFMKNASESLYNGFVEPALTVEPQLFTRNSTSGGAWSGWETFRNIANILLSILILVVIFSQLTGYGIDNYGIKKILPKIIVAAVLMNLSYWICIALVDVSNIFGNSLQAFFDGLAGKVTLTDAAKWGLGDAASSAAATVFLPAALLTALAGMIFAVAMEGGLVGLLLALFVGAIAVVISILFLFILLAAREAAIVILTVLSPLALACFMLPNTKRLFDKWWKLFYSLLLVYPICGVLVGGGNYVSKLLLAAGAGEDGFFSAFMAMIIGVVPIFFIPTVLKGSLNMMGQLGAKISGFGTKMGNRISGDANRAVKGSERYKNYQDDRARMRKINAANRDINNLRGRDNLNDRQKRRLAQSMAIVANERENEASRHNMIHGGYDARLAGAEAKADAQRVADIESMLSTGRMNVDGQAVEADSGEGVNSNSPASLAAFHKAALARHASATTAEERSNAMAQIRAVQNMMSKTDAGRAAVMGNLADAVTRAQNANDYSTSKMAASHLMSDFGDLYKTKNRGAHSMIKDLSNDAQMGDVQASIRNGTYDAYGVDKYTEETLAGADDAALDKLIAAMNPIVDADGNTVRGASLTGESLETLQNTAYQALEKSKAGTLNIKPEVAAKLEQIRNGYVPQGVTQAQQQSQSAQQQAQNIQDSILQELQNINTELHNQNRGDNGGQPKPPTILGPDGKPLT